jgi:hypothetical protein
MRAAGKPYRFNDTQWLGLPATTIGAPHQRFRIFILGRRRTTDTVGVGFEPRDSSRGGETLEEVKARRGTIALSHQVIDLAINGPAMTDTAAGLVLVGIMEIFDVGDGMP